MHSTRTCPPNIRRGVVFCLPARRRLQRVGGPSPRARFGGRGCRRRRSSGQNAWEQSDRERDAPALARARDGKTLDAGGRGVLARRRAGRRPRAAARVGRAGARRRPGRGRSPWPGHVLPQGVHPADPAVPRPLPLLHLRHHARQLRAAGGRTCRPTRCSRSPARAPRWAARRRCSPSATARRTAGRRPASGSTRTATTRRWTTCARWRSGCSRRPGCCRTSTPACMSWAELQRLKPVAPSMGMMLETTSTPVVRPNRGRRTSAPPTRTRRSACACSRTPAGHRPVHHRHPRRHRRDPAPSGPSRCSRSARSRRAGRRHVQEVIVQNFRAKQRTAMRARRRSGSRYVAAIAVARLAWGRACASRCRRTSRPGQFELLLRAGVDDWGGVSPLTPTT